MPQGWPGLLGPPAIASCADAGNYSEIVLVTRVHRITGGWGALIGHHCWDATAGTACAALPGMPGVAPGQAPQSDLIFADAGLGL